MKFNDTFRSSDLYEQHRLNACVGDNGNPDYLYYARGFSKAALMIIDEVIRDDDVELQQDDLIYPVCFNMRHSVELILKGELSELKKLLKLKNNESLDSYKGSFTKENQEIKIQNLDESHHIGHIWKFFKYVSEKIDRRFANINSSIDSIINDISDIDPTGQTFRYAFNTENKKHLTDVSTINFFALKENFLKLENGLEKLNELNKYLYCHEYRYKTYTANLNRSEIYKIAEALHKYLKDGYDIRKAKEEIIHTFPFELSKTEFDKALQKINSTPYLSSLIGKPHRILGINENDLKEFFCFWEKLYPLDDYGTCKIIPSTDDSLLANMDIRSEIESNAWSYFSSKITLEILAGLHTLLNLKSWYAFSEPYEESYKENLKEISIEIENTSHHEEFSRILNKKNAMNKILGSIFIIGRNDLAEEIRQALCMELYIFENIKRKALFYPKVADYNQI